MNNELNLNLVYTFIFVSCGIGLVYSLINWKTITRIELGEKLPESDDNRTTITKTHLETMQKIYIDIKNGAKNFLWTEYIYISVYLLLFSVIIACTDNFKFYTTISFLLGAVTSLISGYIGMMVATESNVRVTYCAKTYIQPKDAFREAFNVAFRGGCVMGFCLVSLALTVLTLMIVVYSRILHPHDPESYTLMFEYICGYGLGGSSVALFCRVGGGIFTKAADVGADLVGKNEMGLEEDSPDNPATIADNVGDNVGDIAGMGADLFGSFAESSVAALVVSGTSKELIKGSYYYYPLVISASGILVCLVISFVALHIMTVTSEEKIEPTLRWQLILTSILLTPTICAVGNICLPPTFTLGFDKEAIVTTNWKITVCCLFGLWSGMIIGYFTDYYTSKANAPTKLLAESCKSGAAINIIQGLALGYMSCLVPIICISATIYVSFHFAGMYGISIAALGMLSNLSTCLAIDAYGPISDNAGGISEMSNLGVRHITDPLDAAGNTTAAVGKGFAIGSACLVSLALFGAFITRTNLKEVNILEPIEISCLVVGAMIPYWFSAFTMKSVGDAAFKMCSNIQEQLNRSPPSKNPGECIDVATTASLQEMVLPGILVIFTPLILGGLFGPKAIAGYLAGVIVSGVQMAISSSNSGGAWDNAKKFIEGNNLIDDEGTKQNIMKDLEQERADKPVEQGGLSLEAEAEKKFNSKSYDSSKIAYYGKHSEPHKAAVVGDTVGDPLKDTSGPSLNILIKLSAIVSLVFGSFFENHYLFKA